jgi:hypothetical protein
VVQVHRKVDEIHAAGAELIVIGNGAPHFIAGFRELTGYSGPLYTDPSLAAYEAAHLERGVTTVLNPKALMPTLKAFARGGKQGLTQGDAWQQGGVLVIATDGAVMYQHVSKRPGDNASPDDIVAALTQVPRTGR